MFATPSLGIECPVVHAYGPETIKTVTVDVYSPTKVAAATSSVKSGSKVYVPMPLPAAADRNVWAVVLSDVYAVIELDRRSGVGQTGMDSPPGQHGRAAWPRVD